MLKKITNFMTVKNAETSIKLHEGGRTYSSVKPELGGVGDQEPSTLLIRLQTSQQVHSNSSLLMFSKRRLMFIESAIS
jgi:hypothetical protein